MNADQAEPPIACSLPPTELDDRRAVWQRLAQRALRQQRPIAGGVRLVFRAEEGAEGQLRELARLEAQCCSFAAWKVQRCDEGLVLDVTARGQGVAAVRAMIEGALSARPSPSAHGRPREAVGVSQGEDLKPTERYTPRPVRPRGVQTFGDWSMKVYGIAYAGDEPGPDLVEAALGVARSTLPQTALGHGRYGLGFLGIHEGRDGNFVFVSWWENENELHHRVFFSTPARPGQLRPARPDEPIACVWDLSVLAHERQAWIRHMLANPRDADADAYLADALNGDI